MRLPLSISMESKNIMRISRTMPPQKRRFSNPRRWIPPPFLSTSSLGNLLLKRGAREGALRAYSDALKYAPEDALIRQPIAEQIERIAHHPDGEIPPLRNPFLE